jgi:hypothetical protein
MPKLRSVYCPVRKEIDEIKASSIHSVVLEYSVCYIVIIWNADMTEFSTELCILQLKSPHTVTYSYMSID